MRLFQRLQVAEGFGSLKILFRDWTQGLALTGAYLEYYTGGGARFKIYTYIAWSALSLREVWFCIRAELESFGWSAPPYKHN